MFAKSLHRNHIPLIGSYIPGAPRVIYNPLFQQPVLFSMPGPAYRADGFFPQSPIFAYAPVIPAYIPARLPRGFRAPLPAGQAPFSLPNLPAGSDDPNLETYNGVKINRKDFSDDELNRVKEIIDKMKQDPDGKILLNQLSEGGGCIKRDKTDKPPGRAWANGNSLTLGNDSFSGDLPDLMEVLGHELTHVAAYDQDPGHEDTINEETLASTLGRRIRYRANGKESFDVDQNGQKYTFDGSTKAEQTSYSLAIQKNLKDNTRPIDNDHIFDLLDRIGIHFDINHDGSAPLP